MSTENTRAAVDAAAIGSGVAVMAGWVPTVVGLFTIAWLGMQMVINWPKLRDEVKSWFKSTT